MLASPALQFSDLVTISRLTSLPEIERARPGMGLAHPNLSTAIPSTFVANDNASEVIATAQGAKALLSSYYMHMPDDIFFGLLKQTSALLDLANWDDEDALASLDSYRTMLRAIVQLRPLERPNLGLGDGGQLLAAWRDGSNQAVIEFLENDRMRWSISVLQNDASNVATGLTNVRSLRDIFKVHGVGNMIHG